MPRQKRLKGFAHDIALQFGHSANHFAWLAEQHRETVVSVDLIGGKIVPLLFDVPRNRTLLSLCQDTLERMRNREGLAVLRSAQLTAHFTLEHPDTEALDAVYECVIVDGHGRSHSGVYRDRILPQA